MDKNKNTNNEKVIAQYRYRWRIQEFVTIIFIMASTPALGYLLKFHISAQDILFIIAGPLSGLLLLNLGFNRKRNSALKMTLDGSILKLTMGKPNTGKSKSNFIIDLDNLSTVTSAPGSYGEVKELLLIAEKPSTESLEGLEESERFAKLKQEHQIMRIPTKLFTISPELVALITPLVEKFASESDSSARTIVKG
jgi:hypothetical protein